jgi:hypothetical protein
VSVATDVSTSKSWSVSLESGLSYPSAGLLTVGRVESSRLAETMSSSGSVERSKA